LVYLGGYWTKRLDMVIAFNTSLREAAPNQTLNNDYSCIRSVFFDREQIVPWTEDAVNAMLKEYCGQEGP